MRYETLTESREGIATAVSRGNVAHGRVNRRQLAIGMASLLTGVGYYLAIRPAGSVWFLPATMHLPVYIPGGVVQLTGSFPTLSHTLAFSLLSAGVVASGRRGGAVICALWLAIESAFELGQRASFSSWLILHQPDWIDRVWLLALSAARGGAAGRWNQAADHGDADAVHRWEAVRRDDADGAVAGGTEVAGTKAKASSRFTVVRSPFAVTAHGKRTTVNRTLAVALN
jgi:hypothetical protein